MTHARTIPDFSTPMPAPRHRSGETTLAPAPLPVTATPATMRAEALTMPALRLLLRTAEPLGSSSPPPSSSPGACSPTGSCRRSDPPPSRGVRPAAPPASPSLPEAAMSSSTPSRRQPKKPNLRERAAALRADLETSRQQATSLGGQGEPAEVQVPAGTVPAPAGTHPEAYAMRVNADGLGLHAAPGAAVIVEPVVPEKAGLAVFYLKGSATPVIFDLTHNFRPEDAGPVAPGSELVPVIELCEPRSGIIRLLDSARIERLHRIVGIHTPAEIAQKHRRSPDPLPLMGECPEGMGEHRLCDTSAYPLVRFGETVVYDPAQREPTHGALCVLEWNNGHRSLLLTNLRQVEGKGHPHWWVDPVNRPPSREVMERRLAERSPVDMLHTSEGPFTVEHLQSKIVGTVVGVLVPHRLGQLPHDRRSPSLEEQPAADPVQGQDASETGMTTAGDDGDTDLIALGRQFIPAAARATLKPVASPMKPTRMATRPPR